MVYWFDLGAGYVGLGGWFGACYFLWFGTSDLVSLGWLLRLFTVLRWMFWMLPVMDLIVLWLVWCAFWGCLV